jgi:cob(I)alamin adenosyltransferase
MTSNQPLRKQGEPAASLPKAATCEALPTGEPKGHEDLVDAYGGLDEAVAVPGIARAGIPDPRLSELLLRLQRELVAVAADLAANPWQRRRLAPGPRW